MNPVPFLTGYFIVLQASATTSGGLASNTAEMAKLIVATLAVLISLASFAVARRADARAKRSESIKQLLGEKESVAFAGLKLLRDGLPRGSNERQLVISALMQACVFEGSDRARALLYRVIETNRTTHGAEFTNSLNAIEATFESMKRYNFTSDELNLERGERRLRAVRKVIGAR